MESTEIGKLAELMVIAVAADCEMVARAAAVSKLCDVAAQDVPDAFVARAVKKYELFGLSPLIDCENAPLNVPLRLTEFAQFPAVVPPLVGP